MKNSKGFRRIITLLLTYIVVKIVHELTGFEYDLFREGITNVKFLVDITSWFIAYALIFALLNKILPQKEI